MSTAAPLQAQAAKSQALGNSPHAGLLLQRKCACGSPTPSLTGECAECRSKKRLQTKLAIGASNDPLELEADRVADQVLAAPANPAVRGDPPHIQCFTGQPSAPTSIAAPASVDRVLADSGRPLEPALQQDMEQRFGHDFSRVRVHSGGAAEQSAWDVNAHAYAVGHDIVFGAGRFAPGTHEGRRLIAHELAHVAQQEGAQPRIQRLGITQHALTKGTCGERNVQWVFSLDKPASEDGYIVQHVHMSEFVATCPDLAIGPTAPRATFWEAWFVKKGDKLDWTTVRDKWTDGSRGSARPRTNGRYIARGTVKFFTKKTTGDLGDFDKASADPKSHWGPGKAPISRALPSTATEPPWWAGAPVEGPAIREVWALWDCCDADKKKHSSDLRTKP